MRSLLLLVQLVMAVSLSYAKMLPGAVTGIYAKKPEVQAAAKFAVTNGVNAIESIDVEEFEVVRATSQVVAGTKYGLTIKVTNKDNVCLLVKALVLQELTGGYKLLEKHTNPDCDAAKSNLRGAADVAFPQEKQATTPSESQPKKDNPKRNLRRMDAPQPFADKGAALSPPSEVTPPSGNRNLRVPQTAKM